MPEGVPYDFPGHQKDTASAEISPSSHSSRPAVRKLSLAHTDMGMAHEAGNRGAQTTASDNTGRVSQRVSPQMTSGPGVGVSQLRPRTLWSRDKLSPLRSVQI